MKPKTEVDLARPVVAYLNNLGWEVYQEVESYHGIADIVATQGPLVWVVEAKLALGVEVIGQASRWIGHANYVSVATPPPGKRGEGGILLAEVMEWKGIGHLTLSDYSGMSERRAPRLHRRVTNRLRDSLREEHKTWAEAGNNAGQRWTPFRATCAAVLRYVLEHPGCTMKDLIGNGGSFHYRRESTARSCIAAWIDAGKVPGVRLDRAGKALTLWPAPAPTPEWPAPQAVNQVTQETMRSSTR